jgi:hypothetical protein
VLFALLRSVLWASTQPGWLAPDEDYHWLYINYLVEKDTVPNLDAPFYTQELFKAVTLTHQGEYMFGARTSYSGSPHAVLKKLGPPSDSREPAPPPPRPVLHPPAYYLPGVLIDDLLWSRVAVTRLTAIRYYSAALGALTIFGAWLLAAQILAREWQQLAAAAIASLQPILAFSASTITNDVAVAAMLTLTLAWCAWMLRGPPHARQGIGLGLLFGIAVMVKATMLVLLIVIAAMLMLLWRSYPDARAELKGVLKWTIGIPLVLAGWWYVRLLIVTHSILGERGNITSTKGAHGPGILHAPAVAWAWISSVYRSYWFDYLAYDVRTENLWFWLPVAGMVIVAGGFVSYLVRSRTSARPAVRSQRHAILLIVLTAALLVLPPGLLDTWRGIHGLAPTTMQGRFLTPAYPGLAVIAVIALRDLLHFSRYALATAVAMLVTGAFIFYWHTWIVWAVERFYGAAHGHWVRELLHASYDKPNFVTPTFLATVWILGVLAFIAAAVIIVGASWPRSRQPADEETPEKSPVRQTPQ